MASSASITAGKGSRISPEKLKPAICVRNVIADGRAPVTNQKWRPRHDLRCPRPTKSLPRKGLRDLPVVLQAAAYTISGVILMIVIELRVNVFGKGSTVWKQDLSSMPRCQTPIPLGNDDIREEKSLDSIHHSLQDTGSGMQCEGTEMRYRDMRRT